MSLKARTQDPKPRGFDAYSRGVPEVTVRLVAAPREVERLAAGWLAAHVVEANVPATLLPREVRRVEAGGRAAASRALAHRDGAMVALGRANPRHPPPLGRAG